MQELDWDKHLRRTGFSGTDLIVRDWDDPQSHMSSFMVSTAVDDHEHAAESGFLDIQIVADSQSPLQRGVAEELAMRLPSFGGPAIRSNIINLDSLGSIPDETLSGSLCIFLEELERPFLLNVDQTDYNSLKRLLRSGRLLWPMQVGSDPAFELVVGFARCIRTEYPGLDFTTLAIESWREPRHIADTIFQVVRVARLASSGGGIGGEEYAERGGVVCINRVAEAKYINQFVSSFGGEKASVKTVSLASDHPVRLAVGSPGLLDTLHFTRDDDVEQQVGDDQVEVQVKATGVNLLDVATALAQVPNMSLGFECSGIVTRAGARSRFSSGDRVFAACFGAYRTVVRTPDALVQHIPQGLSFEKAAAIPVGYAVCYHALFNVARLERGEKVLIHYGPRSVGQAAIRLAQHAGAEVFTTTGSGEKRAFLIEEFGLPDDHILSSRDLAAFSLGIMRATGGAGVDVVLNAMTGEGLMATWECLAPFGRFIELGEKDIMDGSNLPMARFSKSLSFAAVDILHIMRDNLPLARRILDNVRQLVEDGVALPARPLQVFSYSKIEAAFREMQTGKHTGKVVAVPTLGEEVPVIIPKVRT